MDAADLDRLIARQQPGWTLEQPFYLSPEVYELERRHWLAQQWYVLGHASEVDDSGAYLVRDLLGESLLVVRAQDRQLRGFYNVCRHRGSRICSGDGRAASLVCPYHAWTYRLDGSLRSAAALPAGLDTGTLGLRSFAVAELGGLLLGSLGADPASLAAARRVFEPGLAYLDIPGARIAARRRYPTAGNWKLVMENFAECYHCPPSHPEYCSVMRHVDLYGRDQPAAAAAWKAEEERWLREDADPGSPVSRRRWEVQRAGAQAGRAPIGDGRQTQSRDGRPVAALLGSQSRFDGGVSAFVFEPFVFLLAANDYATLFQFLPTGPESTDVVISWLVNGAAGAAEVDVERMVWLWDVTTVQDKAIVELNAAGVRSRVYAPGPYSTLESGSAAVVANYLAGLGTSLRTQSAA